MKRRVKQPLFRALVALACGIAPARMGMLTALVEQQLFLVSLGEPTPAMYAVIDVARRVATGQLD